MAFSTQASPSKFYSEKEQTFLDFVETFDCPCRTRLAKFFLWAAKRMPSMNFRVEYLCEKVGFCRTLVSRGISFFKKMNFLEVKNKGRRGNSYLLLLKEEVEDVEKGEEEVEDIEVDNSSSYTLNEHKIHTKYTLSREGNYVIGELGKIFDKEEVEIVEESEKRNPKDDLLNIFHEKKFSGAFQDVIRRAENYNFYDREGELLCGIVLHRWVETYGFEGVAGVLRAYEIEYARKLRETSGLPFERGEAWCERMLKDREWKNVLQREINRLLLLESKTGKLKWFVKKIKNGFVEFKNDSVLELGLDNEQFNRVLEDYKKRFEAQKG